MGTSVSFRAPPVPRWQAFVTALQTGQPLGRMQSELFNAGTEWEEALGAPAVAVFAITLVDGLDHVPTLLGRSERPETALQQLAAEARGASEREGGSSALALAERAFLGVLSRTAAGEVSLSETTSDAAAERFLAARGAPVELVTAYVGELLGQYARHVTAREAGRLTEGEQGITVRATRKLTRQLASRAEDVGRTGPPPPAARDALRAQWPSIIRDAFARGRILPGTRA